MPIAVHTGVVKGPGKFAHLPSQRLIRRLYTNTYAVHRTKGSEQTSYGGLIGGQTLLSTITLDQPYLEPFLRCFVLGMGTAAIFETAHVTLQYATLAGQVGASHVITALESHPSLLQSFSPLVVQDHLALFIFWAALYAIDATAVTSVLNMYQQDKEAATKKLADLVTLPKKMMPLPVTKWLLLMMYGKEEVAVVGNVVNGEKGAVITTTATTTAAASDDGKVSTNMTLFAETTTMMQPATNTAAPFKKQSPGISSFPPLEKKNIIPTNGGLKKRSPTTTTTTPTTTKERRTKLGLKPGQLSPDLDIWTRRAKELYDRRCYLKNQWYAAALSEKVIAGGRPVGVEILGKRLTLFRGSDGVVKALGDACPHRGAPLSGGWVSQVDGHDCVVCPYHGWAFDGSGKLVDVPAAESSGEWPQRQLVPTAVVEEKGGFIWLFSGSDKLPSNERPPIPWCKELSTDDNGWKAVYGEMEFNCPHWGVFENAVDFAHVAYLHSGSFGNQDSPQIRNMKCVTDAYGVTATFSLQNKPASMFWEWTRVPEVHVTARAFLPSTSMITFTLGAGLSFTTFVNTVPINATKTINRYSLVRNLQWDNTGLFNADAWDHWAKQAMHKILSEDKVMVEQLRPEAVPREFSVRADLAQIDFRRLRQQYVDMGYGIPPESEGSHLYNNNNIRPDY